MLQVGQVDECGRLELKEGAGHRVRAVCAALRHGRGRRGRAERPEGRFSRLVDMGARTA